MFPHPHHVVLLVALAASACSGLPWSGVDAGSSGTSTGRCQLPFAGDPRQAAELEVTVLDEHYRASALLDGGALPMMFPPQGGRVAFVGVRARNVDPCQARLTGVLRDTMTRQVRLDARTVNLRATDGGWAQSAETNITTFANIPLCPNQWTERDLHGNPFDLEVTLEDRDGRHLQQTLRVTPYCAEPESLADCLCTCRGGYRLGQSCNVDGGAPDGGGG
ncbi:MAG: hypothetical protein HY904_23880 [Deltaproteobacteria bacterium]|nr:hypothetical protein [Deltaproteobacteria bacterium]